MWRLIQGRIGLLVKGREGDMKLKERRKGKDK